MTANIKKIFILLFVIGLLLPRLPLGNSNDTESENNPLSYINWKNEVFQEKFTSNFNKCFNNLDFLTKLKNQIEYSFFDRSKVIDLFIGDGGNIYKKTDIEAYTGLNSIGSTNIKLQLKKLQYVSDKLAEENKKVIIALMPSKALVTSNFTKSEENTQSNYQLFTQYQSEFELNLIDFNKVYNAKENTKILFNPASNELSKKEVVNILDSTLKYTSKSLKTNLKSPTLDFITEELDTSVFANPLNLLFSDDLIHETAQVSYNNNVATSTEKILCIGDESSKPFYETAFMSEVFSGGTFWFNGKEVLDSKDPNYTMYFENNLLIEEVKKSGVVLILIEPSTLDNFAFGTVNHLYDYYSPEGGLVEEYSEYEQNCILERQKTLLNDEHKRMIQNQSKDLNINYFDNLRGHLEYTLSLQNKTWIDESEKFTEFQAQSIFIQNILLKNPKKKQEVMDSSKATNCSKEFILKQFARKIIEQKNINGFTSVIDSLSPLHLAILNIENKILLDDAWSTIVSNQAKEKGISYIQSLYDNAKYVLFIKYEPYFNSLDEGKKWVNNLYYTNEIKKKDNWVLHIDQLSLLQKKTSEEIIRENMLFLAYINRKNPLNINIDQAWTIQHELNIRNDKAWFDKVKTEAKQKKISVHSNLREHAAYMYFLQKGNGA